MLLVLNPQGLSDDLWWCSEKAQIVGACLVIIIPYHLIFMKFVLSVLFLEFRKSIKNDVESEPKTTF